MVDSLDICKSCRECCIGTEIRVNDEDMDRWKKESRLDILLSINPLFGGSRHLIRKKNTEECIFLSVDGACKIQDSKPNICNKFPTNRKHAKEFKCKAIDLFSPISKIKS